MIPKVAHFFDLRENSVLTLCTVNYWYQIRQNNLPIIL